MACDKRDNVRFRVIKTTRWWWEKAQDGVKRLKCFVRRDSDDKDVLVAEKRTDLREGATYVAEKWCTLSYPPSEKFKNGTTLHFTEGQTTEVDGAKPAADGPSSEAPPAESTDLVTTKPAEKRPVDVFEMLRATVGVAKAVKDFCTDPICIGETKFDAEDIRTMLIQAYREGAVRAMVIKNREGEDDVPF